MADGFTEFPIFIISFVAGAAFIVWIFISKLVKRVTISGLANTEALDQSKILESKVSKKSHQPQYSKSNSRKKHVDKRIRDGKQSFNHQWLLTSLKGHSSSVLDMDFSPNGKFLATCGEDRSIFIWTTKDWYINDHKNSRVNIEFDHACLIRWSPDSKGFIVRKVNENILEAYKINKRNDGRIVGAVKVFTYPKLHSDEIIGLGISSNGKYIMSCSNDTVIISDVKGSILARIDTLLTDTYDARLSPCGKFVAASGLAPEAKTWEVQFSKTGEFTEIVEAFNLEGHDAGIHQTAFTNDTSRMGTISKDGTWRLYDIRVEYQKDEKPRLLQTARYEQDETEISRIALSPNGNVVAAACGSSLFLYNADTGEIDSTINDIFPGPITRILFDDEGKYILVSGYKHVHIFHNVTGLRAVAAFATNKLNDRNLTSATRERLEKQISDAEAFIASLEK